MSIIYNIEPKRIPWEQHFLWTKTSYWLPSEDEDLKNEDEDTRTKSILPHIGMLEAALLSEKVVMYTIQDCVLSKIQTEILATLLPSELITQDTLQGKTRTHFVGVLMFGDVSGFTALCEKYFAEGGKGGTYKLTATLNCYIGAMVDVIYSYGGDIIKFSGDAFLAVWKVGLTDYIFEIVHKVIECAMYIQHSLGSFETDANVLLRVKLAISAGNLVFSSIGAEQSKYYVIYGLPVDEVKEAQDTCVSGDVILAPSAWGHCSQVNYLFTNKDEKHIKILRIIYHPMQVTRKVYQLPPKQIVDLEKKYKYQITRYKQLESATDLTNIKYETVRPEVNTAAERQIGPYLRPYLIPPVVAQVDAEQPLEYLTEMRQVTTVFINVVLEKKGSVVDIIERVDEVYTLIWQVVHKQMGVVNKVCMFDKDIMFLVIFGLRGAHHEYNALKSLKCAYKIRSTISQIRHVLCISCGVTVGMAYCGVVGHPLRQEYTVIGAPVNKAARLMMYYPNRVTCDQQTYFSSGLSSVYFVEQEQKVLKGIGKVGGIYEYTEGRRGAGNVNIYSLPPLLGQETELLTFQDMLNGADGFPCGILYSGESGVGKSRLIQEFLITCVNGQYRTIFLTLHANHMSIPFHTIQNIFKQIYNIGSEEDIKNRQDRVIGYLQMTEYDRFACLLNPILGINITDRPPPEVMNVVSSSITDLKMMREKVFRKLVELVCIDMIIFIDNIEYCDNKSADFLPIFLQEGNAALVMTVGKKSFSKPRRWFKNVKLIIYQLENLEDDYIAPLACQLIGVRAIPVAIEALIINQPDANPGWCQRYLQSLLDSKAIQIEKIQRMKLTGMTDMIVPDIKLLQKRIIGQEYRPTRITFVNVPPAGESMEDDVPICTIVKTTQGIQQTIPETMEAIIMSAFDCLSPYEQLLLKCGSVIGDIFSREMLHAVLFKRSPKETAQAIKRLFEMHIISCANSELLRHHGEQTSSSDIKSYETNLTLTKDFEISCFCRQRTVHDDFEDAYAFPYYAFCNELQFTVPLFRAKTYDLLPTNQKILFHKRIAAFLELKMHPPEYLTPGIPNYWQMVLKAMSSILSLQLKFADQAGIREKAPKFRELNVTTKTEFQPTLYQDIINHLHKASLKEQEILTIIEYSQAALLAGCNRRSVNALYMAEERIKELSTQPKYKDYDFTQVQGKVLTILAQAYLDMKFTDLSRIELDKARKLLFGGKFKWYFYKVFKSRVLFQPEYLIHSIKSTHWLFGSKSGIVLTRIEFFNVLSINFMVENNWAEAKRAAIKGGILVMKCALSNICLVCDTFSNLMDIYNHMGKFKRSEWIKRIALNICSLMQTQSENLKQLVSYAKLQTSGLICSFLQGKLEECLVIGDQLSKLGIQISAWDATLFIEMIIINVQMRLKKIDKVFFSAEKLKAVANHPLTHVHYFMVCMMLHLYTGVVMKSPFSILQLVLANKVKLTRPLLIVFGLFFIRRNELNKYIPDLEEKLELPDEITMYNVHYEIMFFEYMIIRLVKKIDEHDYERSEILFDAFIKAHDFGKNLTTVILVNTPHLMPRLLLLMAYFCQIKEFELRSNFYLKKALHLSLKIGDLLEYEWIQHNKSAWINFNKAKLVADNRTYSDNWIDHSSEGKHVFWNETEKNRTRNVLYALPLPETSITEYQEINTNSKMYQYFFF